MDPLNDRVIQGAGTCETVWLPWLASQPIKRVSTSDLCPDGCRLVVVAPHPDDEVLACGGLLALRAEKGLNTLIVIVSNGEASHGSSDREACDKLARLRVEESGRGLKALGLSGTSVLRLGIPDGKASNMIFAITMQLFRLLRADDVVLTTWGLDGHPDHEAVCEATKQASLNVGCQVIEAPVWMWHWATPRDLCIPWNRLVALELTDNALALKKEALAQHRSQLDARGNGQEAVLLPSIVERVARPKEYFFH